MSSLFRPEYVASVAKAICYDLIKAGAVDRIKIVGGLRRGDKEVRGASILYISRVKTEYQTGSQKFLFETDKETRPPKTVHLAEKAIEELGYLDYRVDEKGQRITPVTYPFIMKAMYDKKTEIPVLIDLYQTNADKWGAAMIEKTGPASFVKTMQEAANTHGYRFAYEKVENKTTLEILPTRLETDVFTICGMKWIEPRERK